MIVTGSYMIRYRNDTHRTERKKNEPVKYHFTIYSYLCTQKTKAAMVK